MSSDLSTSTMKSELARPATGFISFTTPASAATCCAVGRTAEGSRPAATGGVAALLVAAVAAAPVTATPARNLRRLTSGRGVFRAISQSPLNRSHRPLGVHGRLTGSDMDFIYPGPESL